MPSKDMSIRLGDRDRLPYLLRLVGKNNTKKIGYTYLIVTCK